MSDQPVDSVLAAAGHGRLRGGANFEQQGWQNPYCASSSITVHFGLLKSGTLMHDSISRCVVRPAGRRTGAGSASVLPFLLNGLAAEPPDQSPPLRQAAKLVR